MSKNVKVFNILNTVVCETMLKFLTCLTHWCVTDVKGFEIFNTLCWYTSYYFFDILYIIHFMCAMKYIIGFTCYIFISTLYVICSTYHIYVCTSHVIHLVFHNVDLAVLFFLLLKASLRHPWAFPSSLVYNEDVWRA